MTKVALPALPAFGARCHWQLQLPILHSVCPSFLHSGTSILQPYPPPHPKPSFLTIPPSYYRIMARLSRCKQSIGEATKRREAAQSQEDMGGSWMGVFRRRGRYCSHRTATEDSEFCRLAVHTIDAYSAGWRYGTEEFKQNAFKSHWQVEDKGSWTL